MLMTQKVDQGDTVYDICQALRYDQSRPATLEVLHAYLVFVISINQLEYAI